MILTAPIRSEEDLDHLIAANFNEVIIGTKGLSRFGELTPSQAKALAQKAQKAGLKTVLDWDILMTQNIFEISLGEFHSMDLSCFDAIRVQDPGALEYVLEKTTHPIQLNLESGNHNLVGILNWVNAVGERLERLILSFELPGQLMAQYTQKVPVPIEWPLLTPILLFYSPRSLIKPLFPDAVGEEAYQVMGKSEESPHSGFKVLENRHGTFMFNPKDFSLLDKWQEVKELGLRAFRFDLRQGNCFDLASPLAAMLRGEGELLAEIKERYPAHAIRGFFSANKSDVLFKKLKNAQLRRRETGFLGEVMDVMKKESIAIHLKNPNESISLGDEIRIQTPEGKAKLTHLNSMFNTNGEEIVNASYGDIVIIPHLGGVSIRSAVYLNS